MQSENMIDSSSRMRDQKASRLSAKEFSAKFKSKKECFNFLTVDVGAYLCGFEAVTTYFLRDLIAGKRKSKNNVLLILFLIVVKCSAVKVIFIPQYAHLTIDDILGQVFSFPEVKEYLPSSRDLHRLPRQWIANVFMSVVGKPFKVWVDGLVADRNEKLATEQNLMIDMDPEILAAFQGSTQISSTYLSKI